MGDLLGPLAQAISATAQAGLAGLLVALVARVGLLLLGYYALKRKRPFRGKVGRFMVDTHPRDTA
ncbi:MAG: hypothetical protein J2P46_01850 [Zavarzinella sp.]|nr:hypothetical protein [Zavarzinella sp.]